MDLFFLLKGGEALELFSRESWRRDGSRCQDLCDCKGKSRGDWHVLKLYVVIYLHRPFLFLYFSIYYH